MNVRPRKILLKQKRILRTNFLQHKFDQITEKFSEYNTDTVFDLFRNTVFKKVIYQILGKLPLKFLDFNQLQNLLDLTAYYNRLALKCSSFTIFFG